MSGDGSDTSLTLLGRLRRDPTDQQAWSAFVQRYGRKIYAWGRQWGLQDADAQDVTQIVLAKLAHHMRQFNYRAGGSFRGWLKTIAHNAWRDFLSGRQPLTGGDAAWEQMNSVSAGEDLLHQLEEECDRELLDEAMFRVRLRVQSHTWQAFLLTSLEGLPGAEVADRLGMKVGTVFVVRSKVQKLLQEEVRRLEQANELDSPG